MADLPVSTSLADQVERIVTQRLESGVDLDTVCEQLLKSRRTLSRQLKQEGTGFVAIRDGVRKRRAMELIGLPGMPLKRIARHCGFNSFSAFAQAFSAWTGQSPSAYRRSLLDD